MGYTFSPEGYDAIGFAFPTQDGSWNITAPAGTKLTVAPSAKELSGTWGTVEALWVGGEGDTTIEYDLVTKSGESATFNYREPESRKIAWVSMCVKRVA